MRRSRRTRRPPRACSTPPTSRRMRRAARGRSCSSTTAVRVRRPCGCTWVRSVRAAWSRRIREHKTAAPYTMVDNQYSLLDVTDLVFIDAPGTGFSRIMGKDKEKAFWGIGSGCARVRALHPALPDQVRPLELAQVSVRGELRHAALCGAERRPPERRPERHRAALGNPQLR